MNRQQIIEGRKRLYGIEQDEDGTLYSTRSAWIVDPMETRIEHEPPRRFTDHRVDRNVPLSAYGTTVTTSKPMSASGRRRILRAARSVL